MRKFALITLTCLLASLSHAGPAKVLVQKDVDLVEFRLSNFNGEDSYPRYSVVDPKGPFGDAQMSLRCSEGYDGKTVWKYKEIMVFSDKGTVIKRKEPRGNVASEKGFRFEFSSLDECEKASPTLMVEGANCTLSVQLNRVRSIAKLISARCYPSELESSAKVGR